MVAFERRQSAGSAWMLAVDQGLSWERGGASAVGGAIVVRWSSSGERRRAGCQSSLASCFREGSAVNPDPAGAAIVAVAARVKGLKVGCVAGEGVRQVCAAAGQF